MLAVLLIFSADWPQWRGPDGSGVSTQNNLPLSWSATKNIAWKTAIPGRGHSSPVITGNRIFLTTSIEGPVVAGAKAMKHYRGGQEFLHPDSLGADRSYELRVLAIDAASGKILWERTAYEGTVPDNRHRKNTYASPTPATDGRYLFAYFESQGVYCYDLEGKLIWKISFGSMGSWGMGPGTSPVLFEDFVILQCDIDGGDNSFLVALSKKDGKVAWKTRRQNRATWSTPLVVRAPAGPQLVATGWEVVVSYDPRTGQELWRSPGVDGQAIPSAVAGHGLVFVTSGYPGKRAYALRLDQEGERIVWRYDKGTAYVPSPILYGDYLYLMTDKGLLTCVEAKTGKVIYEGRRVPAPATFTASPVAFDGRILLTSEDGDTHVIKAGPGHEVVATNSLDEPVYASPAIAQDSIFIRGAKHLFRIRQGWPREAEP